KLLVTQLVAHSQTVLQAASTLQVSTNEASQATKQVGVSVEGIVSGIENQNNHTQQSTVAMSDMVKGIQQVTETSATAFEAAQLSEREAAEGQQYTQASVQSMNEIYQTVQQILHTMQLLNEKSQLIGEVSAIISGVAEQTRLLALNASIE